MAIKRINGYSLGAVSGAYLAHLDGPVRVAANGPAAERRTNANSRYCATGARSRGATAALCLHSPFVHAAVLTAKFVLVNFCHATRGNPPPRVKSHLSITKRFATRGARRREIRSLRHASPVFRHVVQGTVRI